MLLEMYRADQSYPQEYESFCFQSCVRQVLEAYNIPNAPFLINSSLDLLLTKDTASSFGYSVSFLNQPVLPDFANLVKQYLPGDQNPLEVWKQNKMRLEEGIPIITGVDIFHLGYTPFYHKVHSEHRVVLCGYSEDQASAYVIDQYQWSYKGKIELKEFFQARTSACPKDDSPYSGSPIQQIWHEVERDGWAADRTELVAMTLELTMEQYYQQAPERDRIHGVSALKKIEELFQIFAEGDSSTKTVFLKEMYLVLFFNYSRLKLFSYYMQQSYKQLRLQLLAELLKQLEEDRTKWEAFLRLILKGIYLNDKTMCKKIQDKFQDIIDTEEKRSSILYKLQTMLSGGCNS